MPATFGVFVVQERFVKAKHLQLLAGVSPLAYWLSTLLWDMAQYSALAIGSLAVAGFYNLRPFIGDSEQLSAMAALLWFYAAAALPFTYLASFIFSSPNGAQISLMG